MSMTRASRPRPPGASPEPDDAARAAIAHAAVMLARISALRRTLPAAVAGPVVVAAAIATPALAQAPSGTGSKNAGESANIWDGFLGFLGWVLLAIGVFAFLVWMTIGRRRDEASGASSAPAAAPQPDHAAAAPPATSAPSPRSGGDGAAAARELTVLTFGDEHAAEHAFGDVRGRHPDAPWARDVAFVECHRHGRIVVRGTFAGHWVDVEDVAASARAGTDEGAVAEAVVGVAFGPPAFAERLAAGGSPAERAALLETVRGALPERSSGIVALATPPEADAMIAAFDDRATRVSRHRLSSDEATAVEAAIAPAPPAASGPQPSSSIS
jgi:hypothetical protein